MTDLYRLAWPVLRRIPPERAADLALWALSRKLVPLPPTRTHSSLRTKVWDLDFPNPLGLAAGCDKDARAVEGFFSMGFGLVEVGTVTPKPQAGNPKPRLFRLEPDGALINRLGFNSIGAAVVEQRLRRPRAGIIGVNLGPNRGSADAVGEIRALARRFRPNADYLVINLSSPNTPGLRDMQAAARLAPLIDSVRGDSPGDKTPIVIKISPDLSPDSRESIAEVAIAKEIDGLIIANTTTKRPALRSRQANEAGGLSGKPLFEPSTALLGEMYRRTDGRVTLIGVGGVFDGTDAYKKIRAGASLVQLYTGLVYRGPAIVSQILQELEDCVAKDGFARIDEAVGDDHS